MTAFKKYLFLLLIAVTLCVAAPATAHPTDTLPGKGLKVDTFSLGRSGKYFVVDLGLKLDDVKVKTNRAKLITPRLVNGADSVELQSLGLYGRRRYYYYERNFQDFMIAGPTERSYILKAAPDTVDYHVFVPYEEWMNGASLTLTTQEFGCCHTLVAMQVDTLGLFEQFFFRPEWLFVRPQEQGPKERQLSGRAYIDFPVDQTIIYPEYRRNTTELGKIQATIDSVRFDKDVTITKVWLKGFASPESPYSHNTDLSLGRVAALKKHIQQLYSFPAGVIETDNEPEDWEGLRRFVVDSNIDHKQEILDLIDSDMAPDPKEALIKKRYPAEYKFMLAQFYPALRHTDYRINYNVRDYTDVDEIRRVFETSPNKLSLNELFILANSYPVGSEAFSNVFATAVRMYPDNPTANLNAATSAMENGDLVGAARFLEKAGDTPDAIYCRGVLAGLEERYDVARTLLRQAEAAGVSQAKTALLQLDRMKK